MRRQIILLMILSILDQTSHDFRSFLLTGASGKRLSFVPFFRPHLSVVEVVVTVPLPSRFISCCGPAAEASRALMQTASYAGFSHIAGFPQAFLPLSSILDASPTVSSSIRARFCSTLVALPPLPFSLEAAMAPKVKKSPSSRPKSSQGGKHKRSWGGQVEEEEETSPPPDRGSTLRPKTHVKSPERKQPARGAKGATPAPSSSSKPSAKRPRTAAQALNPVLPPSELAKVAAAQASPPPKNAPDSSLSIPCVAQKLRCRCHIVSWSFSTQNFPQFMVLPGVNDASFGFPLTVLSPNDPTNLPSYDDANLHRYFRELLSVRDAARAAPWESFEAGDWRTQPFTTHIVVSVGESPTSPACFDSVRQLFRSLDSTRRAAGGAHTVFRASHVETDCRDCLYNGLFAEYMSTLGKWEARKVDVVAELDARERSHAKAVEKTLELAIGIANSLGELGIILDVGREQFFKRLQEEIDWRHTTIADVLEYAFAPPRVVSWRVFWRESGRFFFGSRDCGEGKGEGEGGRAFPPPACFSSIKRTMIHPLLYDTAYHSGEPMNWAVPSFSPDMHGCKFKSKTTPKPERLLRHGWQWSRIAGMHCFAEGMETEGIMLRWLPALFYFTHGPGCTSCHDQNWACVRYYDGPDLVAACVRCLDQRHACTPVADFNFVYMDGRVLLLNHRLSEAIIRNNTWFFSEGLGSDIVDKLKALAIFMSTGTSVPPWTTAAGRPRMSIAKAAVACRPFSDAAQASDMDSLKQVMGMFSELAHVFETTSNDLNSFLAMCNVRTAEQATFLMSPDEHMDDSEEDRNAWESDVPGFALLEGVETGVEVWDGKDGTGGGTDVTGGSSGMGTSSGARASDDVEMRDVEGSGDAGPSWPPVVSSTVLPARTLKIPTGAPSLSFGLPGTVLGAGGSLVAGALGEHVLISLPRVHPSLPPWLPTPALSKMLPAPSAVSPLTNREPETPEAPLCQGGRSEGAGQGPSGA
ncbi:hypothetical protein B0H17DRAFT_1136372 [Mycena rosella]|uniref:HMG domain-containing protein n=1 Tax=Mycena rosella TaxID=1033263 RepID=A0AAD7GEI9_MYCRO|nr:hypothetical protein B0H17DRAFT_1136372 [Mycena rosella]